jgi:formylglycine-generating enzyme required for sulfatase activity
MPATPYRLLTAVAWVQAIFAAGLCHAQIGGATPAALASESVDFASIGKATADQLAGWQPDEKQKAILASLPTSVEAQRRELIRLSRIPLPTYEERERFSALLGHGFPKQPRHPLRDNAPYLINHYLSQGAPSQAELDELIGSLKKRLIHLKGGRFVMGDFGPLVFKDKLTLTGQRDSGPPHEVQLDAYSIMKGQVTHGEYDLYLRTVGRPLLEEGESIYPHRPGYVVIDVKWPDADGYCQWLGQLTGRRFALTTEAQWEYAAREGGKLIAYPMYHLPDVKWQNKYQPVFDTAEKAIERLRALAGKETDLLTPNPPSLHGENRIGMQGVLSSWNLEWVADWYQEDYYKVSPKRNPRGPDQGTERVARVGSSNLFNLILSRNKRSPDQGSAFRCVLNESKPWK